MNTDLPKTSFRCGLIYPLQNLLLCMAEKISCLFYEHDKGSYKSINLVYLLGFIFFPISND